MPVKSEAEKSGGDAGTDLAAESATSGYGLTGLPAYRLTGSLARRPSAKRAWT